MHLAARNGHQKVVEYLWDKGGMKLLGIKRFDGRTALASTILNGDQGFEGYDNWGRGKILELMVRHSPDMLTDVDTQQRTCLHFAAQENQVHTLEWLLKVMHSKLGLDKALELLLSKDEKQVNCLHTACVRGSDRVVMFLVDQASLTKLDGLGLSHEKATQVCRDLLSATAFNGRTALHFAASLGRRKIVRLLLTSWAEHGLLHLVEATQSDGRNAACSAANYGHLDVLEMIHASHPSCISAIDNDGWSIIHWVADSANQAASLDRHEQDDRILQRKHKKEAGVFILEFLCRHLSSGDSTHHLLYKADNRGRTALHLAARFGSADMVRCLFVSVKMCVCVCMCMCVHA